MTQMRRQSERKDKLRVTNKPKTEECSPSHTSFGIVEESVDTGVSELGGNLFDEEEIRIEPTKIAENFVARNGRPDMKRNEGLGGINDIFIANLITHETKHMTKYSTADSPVRWKVVCLPSKANK